jgi:hypothetical protein
MTSDRKKEANRENAQLSTGPKTAEGKRAIRHNALKHGILAKATLLPNEDPELFSTLREELRSSIDPVGELEETLVEMIASCAWRLRRLLQAESGLFAKQIYGARERRARQDAESFRQRPPELGKDPLEAVLEMADLSEDRLKKVVDKPRYAAALERADEARARLETEAVEIATAFSEDATNADVFSKLSRYETTIERALFKALNELRSLQEARRREEAIKMEWFPDPEGEDMEALERSTPSG